MTSVWDTYPENYRASEVQTLRRAALSGDCAAVIGLSGAGKSNLFGFLANRANPDGIFVLVDGNRLAAPGLKGYLQLVLRTLQREASAPPGSLDDPAQILQALEGLIQKRLEQPPQRLCLLLDRFDALPPEDAQPVSGSLRSLRDQFKYQFSLVSGARRPPAPSSEMAELTYACTLWLGPLAESDALWSARQFARRKGLEWDEAVLQRLFEISRGYPAFLRAACEAHAGGSALELGALLTHPAVQQRLAEFWSDQPSAEALRRSGLEDHPFLEKPESPLDTVKVIAREGPAQQPRRISPPGEPPQEKPGTPALLTQRENRLYEFLRAHPGEVCEKDDLICAVWPEDKIFTEGLRDDSLAQLVRRLRTKIEPDPDHPRHILNVPGRGYRFMP